MGEEEVKKMSRSVGYPLIVVKKTKAAVGSLVTFEAAFRIKWIGYTLRKRRVI